jgi:hypothetical protein
MFESKNQWHHQQAFQWLGMVVSVYVSTVLHFLGNFCVPPSVTKVTISPYGYLVICLEHFFLLFFYLQIMFPQLFALFQILFFLLSCINAVFLTSMRPSRVQIVETCYLEEKQTVTGGYAPVSVAPLDRIFQWYSAHPPTTDLGVFFA